MTPIAALVLLLLTVAWLTASATAVRSVSRIWLRHWVERRLRGATAAERYLERPHRLLVGASTGAALAVVLGGVVIAASSDDGGLRLALRLLAAAMIVLIVGQLIPRALARRWATRILPVLLPLLRLVGVVVAPLLMFARLATRLGRAGGVAAEFTPRGEIEDLLREGALEGVGERDEIAIITGVVNFGEKTLADVLTPRDEVFALDQSTPAAEVAARIASSAYSRVPLYRGSLDDVVGMVHVFDVLKAGADGSTPPLRPIAFAAPGKPCNEQLFEMLRARRHLAIVREGDRTLGLVTLEDLLEELVGDIRDEHDEPSPMTPAAPGEQPRSSMLPALRR